MAVEIFGHIDVKKGAGVQQEVVKKLGYRVPYTYQSIDLLNGSMGATKIGIHEMSSPAWQLLSSDKYVVCTDMTLYNRNELINRLDHNPDPQQLCNSELLIRAFEKWGFRCVDYLSGDFAFALWNKEKQELFCARDKMGVRPFYFTENRGGIFFSSSLKMMEHLSDRANPLDEEFFLDTLVTMISDKSLTTMNGVFRLPPAHLLIYRQGNISVKRYWEPDSEQKIRYRNENDYTDHFRELLIKAVKNRCKEAGSIGSELSGGLDSTTTTCIAADYASEHNISFAAFSNTLPENHGTQIRDEREHIQKVLSWKHFRWEEVNWLKTDILSMLDYSMSIQGAFTQQRFHIFNQGIYEAAGNEGVYALLSGFGGDELVSARTGVAWNDLVAEGQWIQLCNASGKNSFLPVRIIRAIKHILHYYQKKNRPREITSGVFNPDMLTRRFENLALQPEFSEKNQLKERYFHKHERLTEITLARRQVQKISHPHVSQRMEYSNTAAIQYGIQYRYPLLDVPLIQTTLSYPAWVKNQPGTDRVLFRNSVKGLIPEEIRLRNDKTGMVIPHIYLRLLKDRDSLISFLNSCSSREPLNSIFDFRRFENWLDAILSRNKEDMNYLMPGAFYNYLMIILWFSKINTGV